MKLFSNDNDVEQTPRLHDASVHGHASLLLVECLIHELVKRSVISVSEVVEIIDRAAEMKRENGPASGESLASCKKLITLIELISGSLRSDIPSSR